MHLVLQRSCSVEALAGGSISAQAWLPPLKAANAGRQRSPSSFETALLGSPRGLEGVRGK